MLHVAKRLEVGEACAELEAQEPEARWRAAAGLAQVHCAEAIWALEKALADPEPFVRWEAARAIGEIARQARAPAVAVAATQVVLEAAAAAEPGVRAAAADAIGAWGAKGPLEPVLRLAHDGEASVRAAAVRALGLAGGGALQVVSATLQQALADEDAEVRRMAANAIGWCRDESAATSLCACLHDPAAPVRAAALRALARLSTGGREDLALPLLQDPDPTVRAEAVRFLRQHGTATSISALENLAGDGAAVGEVPVAALAIEARRAVLRRLAPWPVRLLKK